MKYAPSVLAHFLSQAALAQNLYFMDLDYPSFNWKEGDEVKGGMANEADTGPVHTAPA
ncbi:hypothetical protein [Rhodoferax sp. PAMC 29310]|uniref:hypothetical protein n=1 Tax=Rhodoferax sp. PAMC 29310 TaxID=2822760 RepID=UPI001B31D28C|nr:hypothetical protein [Rhodoferax sp. PAMC 29310]